MRSSSSLPARIACAVACCLAFSASARAHSLQLPAISLPAASSAPRLMVGPADIAGLQARKTDPAYSAYFASFRGFVDARITTALTGRTDDDLAQISKGAALLGLLGENPPAGPYASYRAAAVAAIKAVGTRTPRGLFSGGTLDDNADPGRFQSMAEAYDMLRGTGVGASDDAAMRAKLENWGAAFAGDQQLGLNGNNHSVKGGAALVTAALALSDDSNASAWLSSGLSLVGAGFSNMASTTGWWRESSYYLNYSLNNLVPTAWHVRRVTGIDWFTTLRPMVRFAIDMRQPDGRTAAFEEGLPVVFPLQLLWPAYSGDAIAGEMAWAWETSGKDTVNFTNQQLAAADLFVFADASTLAAPPTGSPTRMRGGDASAVALRSGWDAQACQATLMGALDYSSFEFIDSRHNLRNPIELVVSGGGALLLPAAGGGPTVTTSPDRPAFLNPANRNLVLIDGGAPFLLSASDVTLGNRLDTHEAGGAPGLLDAATIDVRAYGGASRVARTVALVGGQYVIVADEVEAPSPVAIDVRWHGRGARAAGLVGGPPGAVWTLGAAALDAAIVSSVPASIVAEGGRYADTWNHEETTDGIGATASASEARFLAYLQPRSSAAPSRVVTDLGLASIAALRVGYGTEVDEIISCTRGQTVAAGSLIAAAALGVVRSENGTVSGFGVVAGSQLSAGGRALFAAGTPITLAVKLESGAVRAVLSPDNPSSAVTIVFYDLPGIDVTKTFAATFQGAPIALAQDARGFAVTVPGGGGVLAIAPGTSSGTTTGGTTGGGQTSGGAVGGTSTGTTGGAGGCTVDARSATPGAIAPIIAGVLVILLLRRRRMA